MSTTDDVTVGAGTPGPVEHSGLEAEARRALEALVMVAESPADPQLLAQLVELSPERVEQLLGELAAEYEAEHRGFRLVKAGGGWRFCSHEDCAPYVERYVLSGQSARLSAAALETLAIVAYKQPISRAQVAAIRGVNVDGVMRTLTQRGYIAELGRDEGPGQATLFGTTPLFLERLGLNDVGELPSLGDFIPGADVVELLEAGLRADAEARDDEADARDDGVDARDDGADARDDGADARDDGADETGTAEVEPGAAAPAVDASTDDGA
jgi:segregation and condensation protein B